MFVNYFKLIYLVLVLLKCISGENLQRRHESEKIIYVNIDGKRIPVTLPGDEIPSNIPENVNTQQNYKDQRLEDHSIIILPSTDTQENSWRDINLPNGTPSIPSSPINPVPPPAVSAPANPAPAVTASAVPAPAPLPPPPPQSPNVSNPSPPIPPAQNPPPPNLPNPTTPPANTPQQPTNPISAPTTPVSTPPIPQPTPTPAHSSPTTASSIQNRPQSNPQVSIVFGSGWGPFYHQPFTPFFGTNSMFGPIYPIYTASPVVFQYVTAPTLYYMQVIQIIYSVVPQNTIPLSNMMDLSLAITNIMRSNAESLNSVVTSEPDGPTMMSESYSQGTEFRTNTGFAIDIPNPDDVTNQIQIAVQQTMTENVPDDIQNDLIKALSKNVADLLKPLYQNIAYTRQLKLDTNSSLSRRDNPILTRRNPADPVTPPVVPPVVPPLVSPVVPPPVVPPPVALTPIPTISTPNVILPVVNASLDMVNGSLQTMDPNSIHATPIPSLGASPTSLPAGPFPPHQNPLQIPPNIPNSPDMPHIPNPNIPEMHNPLSNPFSNLNPNMNANINTNPSDLFSSLISLPNSVLQNAPSIFSIIPNPFKIFYSIMNTIATLYPKIQMAVLVGLVTAITQIIAKILEMIASFLGIFASFGRRRRSIPNDLSPQLKMDEVLNDLHKEVKKAVDTYVPEAPKETKKALTNALYLDSLEVINNSLGPIEEKIKEKNQPYTNPIPNELEIKNNINSIPMPTENLDLTQQIKNNLDIPLNSQTLNNNQQDIFNSINNGINPNNNVFTPNVLNSNDFIPNSNSYPNINPKNSNNNNYNSNNNDYNPNNNGYNLNNNDFNSNNNGYNSNNDDLSSYIINTAKNANDIFNQNIPKELNPIGNLFNLDFLNNPSNQNNKNQNDNLNLGLWKRK